MSKREWTEEQRQAAREWGSKGGRPVKPNSREGKVAGHGMEVQRIRAGGVTYVQTYVRCGKKCQRCRPGGSHYQRDRPGHGPYWFVILQRGERVIRKYLGRELKIMSGKWEYKVHE